ncbi:ATP-binding protein [Actinobaculum suis]|uniref:ATP-binding protein n=1 Tax=Actinobaculum suis TaxID=1657 RepID=A0AAW9HSM6_9ACTO|nr:ATP-binding protein [Actinobaculum suis]MDY5152756.1 ATP-binding protein [Actinobaculum suis]
MQCQQNKGNPRRLKQLGLPATKTFDTFDPTLSTIPAHTLSFLEGLEWIDRKENLVLAGPAGTGKSHLAAALAQKTVQHGGNAAWLTLPDLERLVASHRVDYTIEKTMNKLARNNLIIIDDIGLLPITQTAAEGFYRICDAAYERTSLLITTNQHPSHFDKIMPTSLATAAVDRLLHHAHIHITSGDSIRLTHSLNNTTKQA